MTNYEKLCKKIDIKLDFKYSIKGKKITIINCDRNSIINFFSGKKTNFRVVKASKQMNYTAEKQIELVKLISKENFVSNYVPKKEYWVLMTNDYASHNNDFSEALAGLILQLIETGELDKEEVKRVLE